MSDFWTRRRAAVQAEEEAQAAAARAALAAEQEARLAERDDAELLAEAGLPDPDTLESAEQVQAFLRSELPQRLKSRALRRLWRMNPVLACLDGLNDYDEDYTDALHVRENLQTAYKVGRGILREIAGETPEEPAAAEAPADAPDSAPCSREQAGETALAAPAEAPAAAPGQAPDEPEPQQHAAAPAPRRMRFTFET